MFFFILVIEDFIFPPNSTSQICYCFMLDQAAHLCSIICSHMVLWGHTWKTSFLTGISSNKPMHAKEYRKQACCVEEYRKAPKWAFDLRHPLRYSSSLRKEGAFRRSSAGEKFALGIVVSHEACEKYSRNCSAQLYRNMFVFHPLAFVLLQSRHATRRHTSRPAFSVLHIYLSLFVTISISISLP